MVSGVSAELGLLIFTVAHCCLGGHIPSKTDHSSGPSELREYRIKRDNQTDSTVPLRLQTYNDTEPAEHLSTRLKDQYRNDRLLHTSRTSFLVPAFGRQFVLDLELNHGLLSSRYVERYYTNQSSKPVVVKGTEHCYYHGRIRGRPGSTVALSTCNGLLGMFDDGDSLYFIRPSDEQDVVPEKNGQLHIVYRTNVKTMQQEDVLVRDEPQKDTKSSRLDRLRELLFRRKPKARLKRDVLPETKYIELILVNDNRMFQMYKNNTQRTSSVAKTVANLVDAMYSKQLNTRIALVAIETWDSEDQIAVDSDAQETLRQFLKYRYQNLLNWQSHDAAHLLSGMAFEDGVTGQAPINGICTKRNSGGVNENQNPRNAVVLAVTLAHQLGHNLGMHDDNGRDCFKACPDWYGCIMEKERGIQQPRRFSECSVRDYRELLTNGLGACMFNRPEKLHEPPYCGNGFIEAGEQCDCGPPSPTNMKYFKRCVKCCDNCKLAQAREAQCAHGECCDLSSCKYKDGGMACRAPVNACDLEEKCTGRSGECPDNLYKQDGQLCEVDGHCYYGECRTRTNQCKYVWGEDVYTADDVCYQRLNINGNRDGNCGKSEDGGWDKCEPKDIFCGYLLCDGNVTVPRVGVLDGSLTSKSYPRTGKTMHCKGGHVLLDDSNNIGYVQDGTTCGTNKMCHSGRCVEVSNFNITPCPVGVNGLPCSGHGNCTNQDSCLCDTREWRGKDCGNYVPIGNNGEDGVGNQGGMSSTIIGIVAGTILGLAIIFGGTGWGFQSAVRRGKRSGKSTPKTSPTEEKDTQGDGKTADGKGGGNTTSPNSPAPCSDGDVCVGSEGHMTVTVAMPRDETAKSTPQANGVIHTSDDDHTSGEINPILYLNGHAPHVQANGHTQRNGYAQADGHAHGLPLEGDANSDTQPSKSKRSRRSGRKKHTNKDADGPTEQDKTKHSQRRPHHDHEHENKVRRGPPPPPSHETHVNAAEHNATGHSPHSTRKGDKRNFVAKWIEDVNYNKHDGPPPPRFVRSDSPKHKVKMSASPEPIRRPQTLKVRKSDSSLSSSGQSGLKIRPKEKPNPFTR